METVRELTDYERERGKPMPSLLHGITQAILTAELLKHLPEHTITNELALELDGQRYTPDICVHPRMQIDYTHDEVRMTEPPLMAVEIMSPTQGMQEVVDKIRAMMRAGVRSCWLVQPTLQTVTVFDEAMQSNTYTQGVIDDPSLDVEIRVEDVFAAGARQEEG